MGKTKYKAMKRRRAIIQQSEFSSPGRQEAIRNISIIQT
jgi:hypothetical protein